jgi:hypothetical protein
MRRLVALKREELELHKKRYGTQEGKGTAAVLVPMLHVVMGVLLLLLLLLFLFLFLVIFPP